MNSYWTSMYVNHPLKVLIKHSNHKSMDQSISVLCVLGWYVLYFYLDFNTTFCMQIIETLIRCSVLLILI